MGLGSGIRKKPIPDPGSRGQKGIGSRIRNTAYKSKDPHQIRIRISNSDTEHYKALGKTMERSILYRDRAYTPWILDPVWVNPDHISESLGTMG
jgi:hypothetical protein